MTREEFANVMKMAADPVNGPVALDQLRSWGEEMFTTNETLAANAVKDQQTIAELRDVNMKLYLKTGAIEETGDEHEETIDEMKDRLRSML